MTIFSIILYSGSVVNPYIFYVFLETMCVLYLVGVLCVVQKLPLVDNKVTLTP